MIKLSETGLESVKLCQSSLKPSEANPGILDTHRRRLIRSGMGWRPYSHWTCHSNMLLTNVGIPTSGRTSSTTVITHSLPTVSICVLPQYYGLQTIATHSYLRFSHTIVRDTSNSCLLLMTSSLLLSFFTCLALIVGLFPRRPLPGSRLRIIFQLSRLHQFQPISVLLLGSVFVLGRVTATEISSPTCNRRGTKTGACVVSVGQVMMIQVTSVRLTV